MFKQRLLDTGEPNNLAVLAGATPTCLAFPALLSVSQQLLTKHSSLQLAPQHDSCQIHLPLRQIQPPACAEASAAQPSPARPARKDGAEPCGKGASRHGPSGSPGCRGFMAKAKPLIKALLAGGLLLKTT